MENEHQGLPEEIKPPKGIGEGVSSTLAVVALVSIGIQLILFFKSAFVDGDIAIAGFSLFFLALFGLVYYLSLKRALPKVVFLSSVICSPAICFGGLVLYFGFSVPAEQSVIASIVSFVFMAILSCPAALISRGWRHEN